MKFIHILAPIKIAVFVAVFLVPVSTHAGDLSCDAVEGASIFGYDGDEYEYIGSIANKYDSNSIANKYGSYGSEYSSDSIWNEYGSWGSKYRSQSAFNSYTSKPPVLINDDEFIGFLTTNNLKYPSVNPYEALYCANNTYASAESDHEDLIFDDYKNIPGNGSSNTTDYLTLICQAQYGIYSFGYGNSCYCALGYEWSNDGTTCVRQNYCPLNSYSGLDNNCYCNAGYKRNIDGTACLKIITCNEGYVMRNNECITHTQDCNNEFGPNTYGSKGNDENSTCYCVDGYMWNVGQTGCIATQVIQNNEQNILNNRIDEVLEGKFIPEKLDNKLVGRLLGNILLQVEEHGEAWYLNPNDSKRYYMKDGSVAYEIMRSFGLGITDIDLSKLPISKTTDEIKNSSSICTINATANRLKGKILLQVQQNGEAYYVFPNNCRMIYMKDGNAAYQIMRYLGLGITNVDLEKIPSN